LQVLSRYELLYECTGDLRLFAMAAAAASRGAGGWEDDVLDRFPGQHRHA
jgi:hypothetical protein